MDNEDYENESNDISNLGLFFIILLVIIMLILLIIALKQSNELNNALQNFFENKGGI